MLPEVKVIFAVPGGSTAGPRSGWRSAIQYSPASIKGLSTNGPSSRRRTRAGSWQITMLTAADRSAWRSCVSLKKGGSGRAH